MAEARSQRWQQGWRQGWQQALVWARGPHLPDAPVLSTRARWALLLGFALLVLLRLPRAVWSGRFLGEEGTIFFAYAWHRGAWNALWRSFGGYLNIGANASTLLVARLVRWDWLSLEDAPHVTMGIALLFQLLPAVLLLWGRGPWLTRRWSVIASLLMIVLAPLSEEVWLNVLHIQYHLALCCGLILALNVPRARLAWLGQGLILLLAPLCGPGALVLGPLFALRTLVDRSLARLAQTAVLGIGGLIQMLVFFIPSPVRGQVLDPAVLAATIFERTGAVPFTGIRIGYGIGDLLLMAYHHRGPAWWLMAGVAMAWCGWLALLGWRHRHGAAGWLIAAGLALAVVSFGGGMIASKAAQWFSAGAGERYNFLPLALLGVALVAISHDGLRRHDRRPLKVCLFVLAMAAACYPFPIGELSDGPDWRSQVALWRQDHAHPLASWTKSWLVDLSDTARPCPKATLATASATDPLYCESAWLARVKATLPPAK